MEIPVHATIAYALIELEIKHNGHFGDKNIFIDNSAVFPFPVWVFEMWLAVSPTELCLMSDTAGGFEVDGPALKGLVGVSDAPADASENNFLKQGKWQFSHQDFLPAALCDYRGLLPLMTHMLFSRL